MLESFGHSRNPKKTVSSLNYVLKNEGYIYIKDYFQKHITGNKERKAAMKKVIRNLNKAYAYNLPDIERTISYLRELNLALIYITRNKLPHHNELVINFEKEHGIDLAEGGYYPQIVDPLELYFKKLTDIDEPIV